MDEFLFQAYVFSLLESCKLYLIAMYKASNCYKIEAVIERSSAKKLFLKISKNSQENPCARVSFLIKLQLRKRFWHKRFLVNIAKFLRTPFLQNIRVAASGKIRTKSLKSVKFQFQLFLTTLYFMGPLYIVTKQL